MKLNIKNKEAQHSVALFGGRLRENKPLAGEPLYSNLIYWAHVEAPEEGIFPMHPHEGIEILTFVFEGGLEHYDTASNKWTRLPAGGVQLIQAGKGVQHSEKYIKGSRAFQIWFDPDFKKSLTQEAYYKDFQPEAFQWKKEGQWEVMTYASEEGPIRTDAPGISARRYKLSKGGHTMELETDSVYSVYLMNGKVEIEENVMGKDSFTRINGPSRIHILATEESEVFVLQSPLQVEYDRIADQ